MKHNKKRNTAFIYETLSRELTKAIVEKETEQKALVISIVKEHFTPDSPLTAELNLYKVLLESQNVPENLAERMLQETKFAYSKLDEKAVLTPSPESLLQSTRISENMFGLTLCLTLNP